MAEGAMTHWWCEVCKAAIPDMEIELDDHFRITCKKCYMDDVPPCDVDVEVGKLFAVADTTIPDTVSELLGEELSPVQVQTLQAALMKALREGK